jgi:hypothetical protein
MEIFDLSTEEAKYISELASRDESFACLVRDHHGIRINRRAVVLEGVDPELLRDYFTERLAKVGFDDAYKPNSEGAMLEALIDKFYRPAQG